MLLGSIDNLKVVLKFSWGSHEYYVHTSVKTLLFSSGAVDLVVGFAQTTFPLASHTATQVEL